MSRPTDTESGAWIAFEWAYERMMGRDLFLQSPVDELPAEFWLEICSAASAQLDECEALRAAVAHG